MASTTRGQRIGIWVIAVVLAIGTIGSFFVIILANNNSATDQVNQQKQQQALQKQVQQQATEQANEHAASSKPLDGYSAAAFDPSSVTDLKVDTLVQGSGKTATATSTVTADYFGWTSDGKIFDSSNQNGKVTPASFSLSQVIPGWTKGLTGVNAGSTVRLTIPTSLAYGPVGQVQVGQPAGPLVFIVELEAVK
jgi:FKBP-type peptidyl-prolyl cis-trans isomerase